MDIPIKHGDLMGFNGDLMGFNGMLPSGELTKSNGKWP